MALKDTWKDLEDAVEGVTGSGDGASADTINDIAHAIIDLENKPDVKIDVDNSLSETSTNPVQNKVVYEAIENLEPFIVEATFTKYDDGELRLDFTDEGETIQQVALNIVEAYKTGKQIVLKLTNENDTGLVYYSSAFEWLEYEIIRWHIHIDGKCYGVYIANIEGDTFYRGLPEKYATEDYVNTQIGDIETSLENIITKYGLGGDSE